ncbi:MAG: ABC transporter ATP-binding protein [Spirochaetota bacterium]|nr:ABC transporter ATP-binding protein [Spirochaetota bacterium]
MSNQSNGHLLDIRNLRTSFHTDEGVSRAVDNLSFSVDHGETLAIVGESGCGKSVTSLSILQLIPQPPGRIESGSQIIFKGKNLLTYTPDQMRNIRGDEISMIFQEPMTSLNPVYTIGNQMSEVFITHRNMNKKEALEASVEMLKLVAIPSPEERVKSYPHELSGGMRQRVMIAMALSCEPSLLIADEPTTALDVTIQAQILKLIMELKNKINMSIMLITHNLGIVAEIADRVIVMYAGRIMEQGSVRDIYKKPLHPYTQGLLKSVPILGQRGAELQEIPGNVPKPTELPIGCKFASRCIHREDRCDAAEPDLLEGERGHFARCVLVKT